MSPSFKFCARAVAGLISAAVSGPVSVLWVVVAVLVVFGVGNEAVAHELWLHDHYATPKRLDKARKERPGGYLVREAPAADVQQLKILAGHLKEKQFVTKFRKTFTKAEMEEDLVLVPAQLGKAVDESEYEEVLPTSPP